MALRTYRCALRIFIKAGLGAKLPRAGARAGGKGAPGQICLTLVMDKKPSVSPAPAGGEAL
jgi:hypothetical protein